MLIGSKSIINRLSKFYVNSNGFNSLVFETDSYETANKVQGDWKLLGVNTDRVPTGSLNIVRPVSKTDELTMYNLLYACRKLTEFSDLSITHEPYLYKLYNE